MHKGNVEYQSFCPVVYSECVSPPLGSWATWVLGGTHSLAGRGWGIQFKRLDRNSDALYSIIPLRLNVSELDCLELEELVSLTSRGLEATG
jgi:hypothetical protein